MKLVVNGQDRAADLGAELAAAARQRPAGPKPGQIPEAISALHLRSAASEADYFADFLRLLRYRDNVDTLPFEIPHKPGWAGRLTAKFKAVLWRLLRYQHDRITDRQNLINHLYSSALEFQQRQHAQEIRDLQSRISDLEQRPK
jgi:hypothetical protein